MPTSIPDLSTRRQVLRAGLSVALGSWAALELVGAGRAEASTLRVRSARRISMVGDSLTSGSLPYQPAAFSDAGWSHSTIDAYVGRGVRAKMRADRYTGLTAVDAIRQKFGDTDAWVVALGTNDAIIYSTDKHEELIREMMDHIGGGHVVMWVNAYLPDALPSQLAWNEALVKVAREWDGYMVLYNWASYASENQHWLATDHVHYSTVGYQRRAVAVGQASRQLISLLAELPPPPRRALPLAKILVE